MRNISPALVIVFAIVVFAAIIAVVWFTTRESGRPSADSATIDAPVESPQPTIVISRDSRVLGSKTTTEWRNASYEVRLGTCAAIILTVVRKGVHLSNDELSTLAVRLEHEMFSPSGAAEEAKESTGYVAGVAVLIMSKWRDPRLDIPQR